MTTTIYKSYGQPMHYYVVNKETKKIMYITGSDPDRNVMVDRFFVGGIDGCIDVSVKSPVIPSNFLEILVIYGYTKQWIQEQLA